MKSCPNPDCNNDGWYVVYAHVTGEPEQEECEWCASTPDSVYNVILKLEKEITRLKNIIHEVGLNASW